MTLRGAYTLITPDVNYRPDPTRAIYVHGPIDNQLVYQLTPRILTLQAENRSPITVYIDSPGGNINSEESLRRLLNTSDQDLNPPCRIITVVTSKAASAAADLLSSGDYAIALPQSTIVYHGIRTLRDTPLTVETTSLMASLLRSVNAKYAKELMIKNEFRFMVHFLLLTNEFDGIRKRNRKKLMSDTECFRTIISNNLSERAKKLLETATKRQVRYEKLLDIVKKPIKYKNMARIEAMRIKAMVDYEVGIHKDDPNWTFYDDGLTQLNDDFFHLNEHFEGLDNDRLDGLCTQWGKFALSPSDKKIIDQTPESSRDKVLIQMKRPLLEPLWSFHVALCHTLQEGENELTAADAYWLGLIDEVMGVKKLSGFRQIAEYQDVPPQPVQVQIEKSEQADEKV